MTIHKGMRWSAAQAYLHPALSRPNLETKTGVHVTRILFEGKQAVGVEYEEAGQLKQVRAEEVLLCGGAINSPQLLQLSGVGDADQLREVGVQPVHHLPGVGANLQDHLEVYLVQQCTKPVSLYSQQRGLTMVKVGLQWFLNQTGDGATTHLESGAFLRSRPEVTKDITSLFLYMAGCPSRYTDSLLPCSSNRSREDSTKDRGFPGLFLCFVPDLFCLFWDRALE